MKTIAIATALLGFGAAACLTPAAANVARFTKECERALALSAGPAYMREQAGVYILGEDAFEQDRASTNGYVCMVIRESEESVVPQCFDRPAQTSHVPVFLDEAKLRLSGVSSGDIRKARADGFASGKYRPAPAPGVVYMASAYNFIKNERGDRLLVWPHVMYHAPYVTDEDIASDAQGAFANPGMPFINESGPLGYMIGFIEKATESSDVEAQCEGQLPDASEWRPFPPRP